MVPPASRADTLPLVPEVRPRSSMPFAAASTAARASFSASMPRSWHPDRELPMSGQVRSRARLCAVSAPDRSRLTYKLSFALRNPGRVLPYARRRSRDALIGMKASDHVSYYRAVMKAETARNREAAVGSKTHDSWLKVGQLQFDYLIGHGL